MERNKNNKRLHTTVITENALICGKVLLFRCNIACKGKNMHKEDLSKEN